METRSLPGLNSELEEGEPSFSLRARDPLAPHLAALWAALRAGDTASAVSIFADTVSDPGYHYRNGTLDYSDSEKEKVASASSKAQEMMAWRKEKGLTYYGLHTV